MKQFIAIALALVVGALIAYFGLGTYINRYFKGRIIDIIIVIAIVCLIIIVIGISLRIANYYFDIFPK
ncbi:MAG: hypothetical protein PHY42_01945 [Bacilli bacterium]|nr:hypothetical protein [Bacilli bacterium]